MNNWLIVLILPIVCCFQAPSMGQQKLESLPALGLLKLEEIKRDLELTPEQRSAIDKIRGQIDKIAIDIRQEVVEAHALQTEKKKSFPEMFKEAFMSKLRGLDERIISEVLVPHQSKRLTQISNRAKFSRTGIEDFLFSGEIKSLLEMKNEDKEKLKSEISLIKKKLVEDIRKLEIEAEKKIVACLDHKAQEEVEELIGEPFHFTTHRPTPVDGK